MTRAFPTITLREVNPENYNRIINLRVQADQLNFVASNLASLAEARVFPNRTPLAIYADDTPVGFLMYAYLEKRQQHWIIRLMIAAEHQGKGYGRAAMRLAIERMRDIPGCCQIFISYEPENHAAKSLYTNLGFCITGEFADGEGIARLDLS